MMDRRVCMLALVAAAIICGSAHTEATEPFIQARTELGDGIERAWFRAFDFELSAWVESSAEWNQEVTWISSDRLLIWIEVAAWGDRRVRTAYYDDAIHAWAGLTGEWVDSGEVAAISERQILWVEHSDGSCRMRGARYVSGSDWLSFWGEWMAAVNPVDLGSDMSLWTETANDGMERLVSVVSSDVPPFWSMHIPPWGHILAVVREGDITAMIEGTEPGDKILCFTAYDRSAREWRTECSAWTANVTDLVLEDGIISWVEHAHDGNAIAMCTVYDEKLGAWQRNGGGWTATVTPPVREGNMLAWIEGNQAGWHVAISRLYDRERHIWRAWGGGWNPEVTDLSIQQGIIVWKDKAEWGEYNLAFLTYDPAVGDWRFSASGFNPEIFPHTVSDGIIYWVHKNHGEYLLCYCIYDAGTWRGGTSGWMPEMPIVEYRDGIITWLRAEPGWWSACYAIYNSISYQWAGGCNGTPTEPTILVSDATVTVEEPAPVQFGNFITSGYKPDSGWSSGVTVPVAVLRVSATSGDAPLMVWFANMSMGAGTIEWDFGDGTTSEEDKPLHTFAAVGVYHVTLTISGRMGTDTDSVDITVGTPIDTHTLSVTAAPVRNVAISGTETATTPCAITATEGGKITVTAPASVSLGGKTYTFSGWFIDDQPQPKGQVSIEVTMDADHAAVAQYDWRLAGDNNEDCVVNLLDLLFVRNRINNRCSQ